MIRAVFDASTVISGVGWGAESYRCLVAVAQRQTRSFATQEIVEEWRETLEGLELGGTKFRRNPWLALEWLIEVTHFVQPADLSKQTSRDPKDDPYLCCAIAASAEFIISRDRDLLDLGKPFGVEIVTPRAFLSRLKARL